MSDQKVSEYATINLERWDSAELGSDAGMLVRSDEPREETRRKNSVLRGSIILNIILIIIIIVLAAVLSDNGGNNASGADQTCITGNCLLETCSSNGIFDNLNGKCDCFECYDGTTCGDDYSSSDACATIDVSAGDPKIFESYWLQGNPSKAAFVDIDPTWGMSYFNSEAKNMVKQSIRGLHALVGNMDIKDSDYIVLGSGSTQLIAAVVYAVARRNTNAQGVTSTPTHIYAEVPYYAAYKPIVTYHQSSFLGYFNPPDAPTVNDNAIEIVTSPNNPDGEDRTARFEHAFHLNDRAYYWPHFTPIADTEMSVGDSDVSLFTLSKISGHAGSRLGWVIVKDASLAALIEEYIAVSVATIPHESLFRTNKVLAHIIDTNGAIFSYASEIMTLRWRRLDHLFNTIQFTERFTLSPDYDASRSQYCSFFGENRIPSVAYAWIKCNETGDQTYVSLSDINRIGCDGVFYDAGINGRPGSAYGMGGDSYVRIELLMDDRTFDLLEDRLQPLLLSLAPGQTYPPSARPTASGETNAPTARPTSLGETNAPTTRPTKPDVTNVPTSRPSQPGETNSPTSAPTVNPTQPGDTNAPTATPTFDGDTNAPTARPTNLGETNTPTAHPTTSAPTRRPTSPGETNEPTLPQR